MKNRENSIKSSANPDLSVCTGENYTIANYEKQSRSTSVPTIQTVKGRVVFFRKVREKISTLKPLTVWIFAVTISPPKTGNRIKKSCPAFVRFILTAKPSTLLRRLSVGYAVALPPRPRPLPKNRMECYAIGLEKA